MTVKKKKSFGQDYCTQSWGFLLSGLDDGPSRLPSPWSQNLRWASGSLASVAPALATQVLGSFPDLPHLVSNAFRSWVDRLAARADVFMFFFTVLVAKQWLLGLPPTAFWLQRSLLSWLHWTARICRLPSQAECDPTVTLSSLSRVLPHDLVFLISFYCSLLCCFLQQIWKKQPFFSFNACWMFLSISSKDVKQLPINYKTLVELDSSLRISKRPFLLLPWPGPPGSTT